MKEKIKELVEEYQWPRWGCGWVVVVVVVVYAEAT